MNADLLITRLHAALGVQGVITDSDDLAPHLLDWKGTTSGRTPCLIRPANSVEVAQAVRICRDASAAIVVQGGNTGLAAGAVPDGSGTQVLLSLQRMGVIRDVDAIGLTMAVEAGCVLATAQQAAKDADLLLPISFGAEGSATIGGIVSTNAGGVNVLRYGMTRAAILGLEVVLPDGTIVDGMRRLRKNNAGYDWKQLFIGSEGTLGIVTAAVLRLVPRPRHTVTALLAVGSPALAIEVLRVAQSALGDQVSAFELMSPISVSLLDEHLGLRAPLETEGWLLLIEASSTLSGLHEAVESMLAEVIEYRFVSDGVIAQSEAQAASLWGLREHVTLAEAKSGASAKHDIAVPIAAIPRFLDEAAAALAHIEPTPVINAFGHVGDGNIHYNVLLGSEHNVRDINRIVHDVVTKLGGSISAEHGIGQYRIEELAEHLPANELALARTIKRALDPEGALNPGKVLRAGAKP